MSTDNSLKNVYAAVAESYAVVAPPARRGKSGSRHGAGRVAAAPDLVWGQAEADAYAAALDRAGETARPGYPAFDRAPTFAPAPERAPAFDPATILAPIAERLSTIESLLRTERKPDDVVALLDTFIAQVSTLREQHERLARDLHRLGAIETSVGELADRLEDRETEISGLTLTIDERLRELSALKVEPEAGGPSYDIGQIVATLETQRNRSDEAMLSALESIHAMMGEVEARLSAIEAIAAAADGYASEDGPAATSPPQVSNEPDRTPDPSSARAPAFADDILAGATPSAREEPNGDAVIAKERVSEPKPAMTRETLIASARRAALAAAQATPAGAKSTGTTSMAGKYPLRNVGTDSDSSPGLRIALIAAVIFLAVAGAGLLYSKLTRKPSGPTITIEEIKADDLAGASAPAAPAATSPASAASDEAGGGTGDDAPASSGAAQERSDIPAADPTSLSGVPGILFDEAPVASGDRAGRSLVSPASGRATKQVLESDLQSASTEPGLPPAKIAPLSVRMQAMEGDAVAQYEIGLRYQRGENADPQAGAHWFARAASQGYAPAQYQLAVMNERGLGIARDLGRARAWYQRSAELGNVKAMHNLAVLYSGQGGEGARYAEAAKWYRAAAEHGLADSQFNLAVLYEHGLGLERSEAEAYKWFVLAARSGDPEAKKHQAALKTKLGAAAKKIDKSAASFRAKPADPAANGQSSGAATFRAARGTAPAAAAVAVAQARLAKLGYEIGTPDGTLDARTAAAIRVFEKRSGLPETGTLSPEVASRLAELAG